MAQHRRHRLSRPGLAEDHGDEPVAAEFLIVSVVVSQINYCESHHSQQMKIIISS